MMLLLRALLLFCVAGLARPAMAAPPPTVTSAGPDRVSVTVYRDPDRGRSDPMNINYLRGFALVTETRTVRLPQGPAVIRFEGVAEGIIPVSAIVDGLPGSTVEKNRDARLLSPASLVDGSLGRIVTLTTTDRATGEVRQEQATIIAGPSPGVVVQTAAGIETLRCSGLPESLRFPTMPDGLSAKPVLSVSTVTPRERTVTVTLSYLASGFDWSASYVATLAPDGKDLNLFAWLTLANNNPERFADADVQVVAGRLNHARMQAVEQRVSELRLNCYPLGTTTSDLPDPGSSTLMLMDGNRLSRDIVVTGTNIRGVAPAAVAQSAPAPPPPPEDLGDLKLYRVPERVTVAPRGQKQVALLARDQVKFERRYRLSVYPGQTIAAASTQIVLKLKNVKEDGLGLALPAGTTALYAARQGERSLLGTGTLTDYAEGQTLRIGAGISSQVRVEQIVAVAGVQSTLSVSNANPYAVLVEVPIGGAGQKIEAAGGALARVDGVATWVVTVLPNDRAELTYHY